MYYTHLHLCSSVYLRGYDASGRVNLTDRFDNFLFTSVRCQYTLISYFSDTTIQWFVIRTFTALCRFNDVGGHDMHHHGDYLLIIRENKQSVCYRGNRVSNRTEWVIHREWNMDPVVRNFRREDSAFTGETLPDVICISGGESYCFAARCSAPVCTTESPFDSMARLWMIENGYHVVFQY